MRGPRGLSRVHVCPARRSPNGARSAPGCLMSTGRSTASSSATSADGTAPPAPRRSRAAGGGGLAYEKDPANHIALRHCPNLAGPPSVTADRSFGAPRSRPAWEDGTPDVTAVQGDAAERTGPLPSRLRHRPPTRRRLKGLRRPVAPPRINARTRCSGPGAPPGTSAAARALKPLGGRLALIGGRRLRSDSGSRPARAHDPVSGRAGGLHPWTPAAAALSPFRRPRSVSAPTAVRPSWSASSSRRGSPRPASPAHSCSGVNCEGRAHRT